MKCGDCVYLKYRTDCSITGKTVAYHDNGRFGKCHCEPERVAALKAQLSGLIVVSRDDLAFVVKYLEGEMSPDGEWARLRAALEEK